MLYSTTLRGTIIVDLTKIKDNGDGSFVGLTMPRLSDYVMNRYFPGREQHLLNGRFVGVECLASEWMTFLKDAAKGASESADEIETQRALKVIEQLTDRMTEFLLSKQGTPFKGPDDFERMVA